MRRYERTRAPHLLVLDQFQGEVDKQLSLEVDRLGVASAKAQRLNLAITSYNKLRESNHTIILSYQEDNSSDDKTLPLKFYGFLKYGRKDLYFYHADGKITQSSPFCLLDFYVDEEMQRSGLGLALFEKMLELTNLDPSRIAYDRPSPKLISFMGKHFDLMKPDVQPNKFTVFEGFHS